MLGHALTLAAFLATFAAGVLVDDEEIQPAPLGGGGHLGHGSGRGSGSGFRNFIINDREIPAQPLNPNNDDDRYLRAMEEEEEREAEKHKKHPDAHDSHRPSSFRLASSSKSSAAGSAGFRNSVDRSDLMPLKPLDLVSRTLGKQYVLVSKLSERTSSLYRYEHTHVRAVYGHCISEEKQCELKNVISLHIYDALLGRHLSNSRRGYHLLLISDESRDGRIIYPHLAPGPEIPPHNDKTARDYDLVQSHLEY